MLQCTKSAPVMAREPSAGARLWCRAGKKSQTSRRIELARLVLTLLWNRAHNGVRAIGNGQRRPIAFELHKRAGRLRSRRFFHGSFKEHR